MLALLSAKGTLPPAPQAKSVLGKRHGGNIEGINTSSCNDKLSSISPGCTKAHVELCHNNAC